MEQNTAKTKMCNKCLSVKPVSEFGKESRAKNGYKPRCKKCTNEYFRSFYLNIYRDKKISKSKEYYANNTKAVLCTVTKYSKINKDKKSAYSKEWAKINREYLRVKKREYEMVKNRTSPEYSLRKKMRKLIYNLRVNKHGRTNELLGYTFDELLQHLGRAPEPHESLDHKIPMSWFLSGTAPSIVNHLQNLQILTRSENSKKLNIYCHAVPYEYYLIALPNIKQNFKHKIVYGTTN